jgi:hypothetical protein
MKCRNSVGIYHTLILLTMDVDIGGMYFTIFTAFRDGLKSQV